MADKVAGQIEQIGGTIEGLAGAEVRSKVMAGCERISASSGKEKIAMWTKGAMDRLDALTGPAVRRQVMIDCGYNCIQVNKRPMQAAQARRRKHPDEEAFLAAEIRKPPKGMRFEREGNLLIQFYTPRTFVPGMRCYCSLLRGLPEGETASLTYCQCSRGFVQKYWEGILGRPVEVDLGETAISGAEECRFVIHL